MDGAGPALTQATAKAWPVQPEVVAQRVEQRHLPVVGRDRRRPAVQIECDFHSGSLLLRKTLEHCDSARPPFATGPRDHRAGVLLGLALVVVVFAIAARSAVKKPPLLIKGGT